MVAQNGELSGQQCAELDSIEQHFSKRQKKINRGVWLLQRFVREEQEQANGADAEEGSSTEDTTPHLTPPVSEEVKMRLA